MSDINFILIFRIEDWSYLRSKGQRRNNFFGSDFFLILIGVIVGAQKSGIKMNLDFLQVLIPNESDLHAIMDITNEAFLADAFFKKPQYHLRFNEERINTLMKDNQNSTFLLVKSDGIAIASIYLQWLYKRSDDDVELCGKFSAISVLKTFQGCGIGKFLVSKAESYIMKLGMDYNTQNPSAKIAEIRMEMGVINFRPDLIQWYQRQGYVIVGEIHDDVELKEITLESMDIYLILMSKVFLLRNDV
eukprot:gene610-1175_t